MYRYALYWRPEPDTPLARAAESWFASPEAARWGRVDGPRRYGFHATLKAPFRLADGVAPEVLAAAAATVTARHRPFRLPALRVAVLDGFVALRAEADPPLRTLADTLVTELDCYRAPLDPTDLARRGADALDAEARTLLDRWGYPHVLSRWRFHLTLTGRMLPGPITDPGTGSGSIRHTAPDPDSSGLDAAVAWLADRFAAALSSPIDVDAVRLVGEPAPGLPLVDLTTLPLTHR